MPTRIGLVSCASTKLKRPAPARDLYTSPLFRKSRAWVEANTDQWFILSAKHHLVHPDTVLEPYNARLGVNVSVWDWMPVVQPQIEAVAAAVEDPLLVVLAGEQYRSVLHRMSLPFEVPMQGLGIGQQLSWLTLNGPTPPTPRELQKAVRARRFGLNHDQVEAYLESLKTLTEQQWAASLTVYPTDRSYLNDPAARAASRAQCDAWMADKRYAASKEAFNAALPLSGVARWRAFDAAKAIVVMDLISPEHYAVLTASMRAAGAAVPEHPGVGVAA